MSASTGIEWTDATWNPTTGCRRVSAGCDNCYAVALAKRLKAMGNPRYQNDGPDGPGFGLTLHWDKLEEPLRWRKPRKVFVNSMSDLFHPSVPAEFIHRCFETMVKADHHQFQILTKRPTYMARLVPEVLDALGTEPPPNVWLGTSVENQEWADKRIPALVTTPAAVRFLSCEPLLGRVDLGPHLAAVRQPSTPTGMNPNKGPDHPEIHWVIVGGESGPGYRPIAVDWVREIRDTCTQAGVPFFLKQWGGRTPKAGGRLLDGEVWNELPHSERSEALIPSVNAS